MKKAIKKINLRYKIIFVWIAILLIPILGIWTWDNIMYKDYTSTKMGITFKYPRDWTIIHDEEEKYNTVLCPPGYENPGNTRYIYISCITFLDNDGIMSIDPFDGESVILFEYRSDVTSYNHDQYSHYRRMDHYEYDFGVRLNGLYRNGHKMVGVYHVVCDFDPRSKCIRIFQKVFKSIREIEYKHEGKEVIYPELVSRYPFLEDDAYLKAESRSVVLETEVIFCKGQSVITYYNKQKAFYGTNADLKGVIVGVIDCDGMYYVYEQQYTRYKSLDRLFGPFDK